MRAEAGRAGDGGAGQGMFAGGLTKTVTLAAPMLALQNIQFCADSKPICSALPGGIRRISRRFFHAAGYTSYRSSVAGLSRRSLQHSAYRVPETGAA